MNIIDHINFNIDCIKLYKSENIDKIYNSKIYWLIEENISLYRLLDKYKKRVVKTTHDTKITFKSNLPVRTAEYKEVTIQDFGYDSYDLALQFNK